jgi:hypothetical protein
MVYWEGPTRANMGTVFAYGIVAIRIIASFL